MAHKTDTAWKVSIEPDGDILKMSVDYTGEIPRVKAYTELLDVIGKWAKKNTTKELRVFSIPKIMSVR